MESKLFFNVEGNTSMAKGGSGDLLSGVIASFMAQGLTPPLEALSSEHISYTKLPETYQSTIQVTM